MRVTSHLLLAGAGGAVVALHTSFVKIPGNLTTRALVRDVYGYSIEPVWLSWYTNTSLMASLLQEVADVTGKSPPVRIGYVVLEPNSDPLCYEETYSCYVYCLPP